MLFGAVEAGGTKFICSVGDEFTNILHQERIETTDPVETLSKVVSFFKDYDIESIGLGFFGPIDVCETSQNYGCITNTPKLKWRNFNIKKYLEQYINVPMYFETDVNVACFGEYMTSYKGKNIVYLTVGTGVGGGAIINGKLISNGLTPEMGHIYVKRREDDKFTGNCPIHKDCLEGLISGPALHAHYLVKPEELHNNSEVWDLVGYYLAEALLSYTYILIPDVILLGGGVGLNEDVLTSTRKYFDLLNNSYQNVSSNIIKMASLRSNAGSVGALLFAKEKYLKHI